MQDNKEPVKPEKKLIYEIPGKFQDALDVYLNDGYVEQGETIACGEYLCQWVVLGDCSVAAVNTDIVNLGRHNNQVEDMRNNKIIYDLTNERKYLIGKIDELTRVLSEQTTHRYPPRFWSSGSAGSNLFKESK